MTKKTLFWVINALTSSLKSGYARLNPSPQFFLAPKGSPGSNPEKHSFGNVLRLTWLPGGWHLNTSWWVKEPDLRAMCCKNPSTWIVWCPEEASPQRQKEKRGWLPEVGWEGVRESSLWVWSLFLERWGVLKWTVGVAAQLLWIY